MTKGPAMQNTPLPKGFFVGGINCGVRRYRPDLGVILSEKNAVTAGVYTLNECKAAPVLYCQGITPSPRVRAILTNSGQANAATGEKGKQDNLTIVEALAKKIGCDSSQVLIASTGVIGVPMEVDKIVAAIPEMVDRATVNAEAFALAILTTDLIPKTVTTEVVLSNGTVRLTGICKGSGMIHPNMATMLGYVVTDAEMTPEFAQTSLQAATDLSFNMISVDGETSTNDCVFLMANGASGVAITTDDDRIVFQNVLTEMMQILAQAIARDGEGCSKLIEVQLHGASNEALAKKAARGITISPLIKTAIHGEDPNWGRILARLGAEGIPAEHLNDLSLKIQGIQVMKGGAPIPFDRETAKATLRSDTVQILVELNAGEASATAWGCDLSKKYIDINAEYST